MVSWWRSMRLEPWQVVKAVNVLQVVDGNMDTQAEALLKKVDDMETKLHDGWVPHRMAWQGMRTMIWPSICYPLPALTLTEAEAEPITIRLYKLAFPALGTSRSLPRVYRFAPACLQGLDLPNVKIKQEIAKLGKLLVHSETQSLTGQLMEASLEQVQLEVGIRIPLLEAPFEDYGMLCTNCWFKQLWDFVLTHDIVVESDDYVVPKLQ